VRITSAPAIASGAAFVLLSCSPSINTVNVTMETYLAAVSHNDLHRILVTSAPYQRELMAAPTPEAKEEVGRRYRGIIEGGYMLWEQAKASRELAPDPLGIALIRAIGLGREGAAAFPLRVRFEEGNTRAIIASRAITNYDRIDWGSLPTGGRIYLLGHPFGKVVNFAPGYDDMTELELLATVDLEWTLVRIAGLIRPEGAPSDWFVEKVEVRPESATSWSPPPAAAP
jgi:hypothetical protein